jgi:hypothetical protein
MSDGRSKAQALARAIEARLNAHKRRLAVLCVSPELLVELLKPGKVLYECVQDALPESAQLVRFMVDDHGENIRLLLTSPDFEPVPAGHSPPDLPVPAIRWVRGEVVAVDNQPGQN